MCIIAVSCSCVLIARVFLCNAICITPLINDVKAPDNGAVNSEWVVYEITSTPTLLIHVRQVCMGQETGKTLVAARVTRRL